MKRYFFMSMTFCFFILVLIMGLSFVEKNGQSMISGEDFSFISYNIQKDKPKFLKIHFMGQDFIFNFK